MNQTAPGQPQWPNDPTVASPAGRAAPSGSFTSDVWVGRTVGPYRIERELARGGMGVVFVAQHTGLQRRVALKVQLAGSEDVERFQIEAQAAARLRHPNIVGIHEVGQLHGRPYLAMDLIDGQSLRERIEDQGPLDPADAARITATLARAVYYAHTRSVLHRDIKPHNVLINREGEPILTDFGLAKRTEGGEGRGLTVTGQVVGTPAYMPPEQAEGALDRIDRRADVYALGATLYHMLTGAAPFDGATPMNVIFQVMTRDPISPGRLRPELDQDLVTICLKCLEKAPEQRYDSAQDLADDLERFQNQESIVARPVGVVGRMLRRGRRHRRVVYGFAALVAVALVVLSVLTIYALRQQRVAEEALGDKARALSDVEVALQDEAEARQNADEARESESQALVEAKAAAKLEEGYGLLALERYDLAARAFAGAWREVLQLRRRGVEPGAGGKSILPAARRGARAALAQIGRRRLDRMPSKLHRVFCSYSSDGKWLAVVFGAELRLYDPRTGEQRASVALGKYWGNALAFVPGQQAVVVFGVHYEGERASTRTSCIELPSGRQRWVYDDPTHPGTEWISVSSDGRLVAFPTHQGMVLVDAQSGQTVRRMPAKNRPHAKYEDRGYSSTFISPAALAIGYGDGTVSLWSVDGRHLKWWNTVVPGRVTLCLFSPPGGFDLKQSVLISGHRTGDVKWWFDSTIRSLRRDSSVLVSSGAIAPKGDVLAVGLQDGRVELYHASGRLLATLRVSNSPVTSCTFSHDGQTLATGSNGRVDLWDVGRLRAIPCVIQGSALVALGSGRVVAWVNSARVKGDRWKMRSEIQRLDLHTGSLWTPIVLRRSRILGLCLTKDDDLVAASVIPDDDPGRERNVTVWDARTGARLGRSPASSPGLLQPTGDGRLLMATTLHSERAGQESGWGEVVLRELPSARPLRSFRWHVSSIMDVALAPDRKLMVSSAKDTTFAVWDLTRSKPLHIVQPRLECRTYTVDRWKGHVHEVWCGTLEKRDIPSEETQVLDGVFSGTWTPDGKTIVTGTSDGMLFRWSIGSTIPKPWFQAHESRVTFCRYVSGNRLVTAGSDGIIRVWDPERRRILRAVRVGSNVKHCVTAGDRVAAVTAEGLVWVVSLDRPELPGFQEDPVRAVDTGLDRRVRRAE